MENLYAELLGLVDASAHNQEVNVTSSVTLFHSETEKIYLTSNLRSTFIFFERWPLYIARYRNKM
jgi:hypothetical protein